MTCLLHNITLVKQITSFYFHTICIPTCLALWYFFEKWKEMNKVVMKNIETGMKNIETGIKKI